jgi:heme-degrading monooxygenase HmoA
MIVRLVSLKLKPDKRGEFEQLFAQSYPRLKSLPGCLSLQLLGDVNGQGDYLTVSHWRTLADLEAYRTSSLFEEIWPQVKALLRDRPWTESYELLGGDVEQE